MAFFISIVLAFIAACHAEPSNPSPAYVCQSRNAYYNIEGSCDSYVRCNDYIPVQQLCPDGLHFNPNVSYPNYPCGYPSDVPCLGRGSVQAAQPTAECPHQYGYFVSPSATADNCGHFRMCIEGRALDMDCPTGLAFNPDTGRCDWPALVPSCKANAYLGFSCPAADDNDDRVENFKHPGNCFYFYSCQHGDVRLLSCDPGMAFEPAFGRCVDEALVNCAQY